MLKLLDRGLSRLMPLTLALGLASVGIAGLAPGVASTELRPVATVTTSIPIATWTVVNSNNPSTSYWTGGYRDFIRVGKSPDDGAVWRGFLQADITSLQGRAISSAYLRITLDHSASCSPTGIRLYEATSSISPATPVTWASSLGYWGQLLDSRTANAQETGACGMIQPDMTVVFQGSLLDRLGNAVTLNQQSFTMGLRTPNEANALEWKKFYPTGIELVVTYID